MGPGDLYRFRAADMFAQASRNLRPWPAFFFSKSRSQRTKGPVVILTPISKGGSTATSNSNNKFRNKSTIGRVRLSRFSSQGGLTIMRRKKKRFKSSWHKPVSASIIGLHHRILDAYFSPEFDEERSDQRTVSLMRRGPYELRLMELSRKLKAETERLWLELFDHDRQRTIDSYSGRTLADITAAAESLCSNAEICRAGV
jgi:hypothetical protein